MDTAAYFSRGMTAASTDSPFLLSTSSYLNDPRLRDWVAGATLRRNAKGYPIVADVSTLTPILMPYFDIVKLDNLFEAECAGNPALAAWMEEGFTSALTRESLAQFGPDSVGGIFRAYLVRNNFEPEFKGGRGKMGKGLFSHYQHRLSQQHDLEHICGGFAFEYISEIGVTWMRMRNLFQHLSAELAGALSLTYSLLMVPQLNRVIMHYPQCFLPLWQNLQQGDLVGATSEPIFMMKYEDVLHLPVDEARAKLGYRNVKQMDMSEAAAIYTEGFGTSEVKRQAAE
jgi:ubiquinone biosynthesis protein COQ4